MNDPVVEPVWVTLLKAGYEEEAQYIRRSWKLEERTRKFEERAHKLAEDIKRRGRTR